MEGPKGVSFRDLSLVRQRAAERRERSTRLIDPIARAFFELHFELAFLKRKADEFQDFFSSIMEKRYPADFVRVKPWGNVGDKKNDGYLKSRRMLFQSYAPNSMEAAKAIAKIEEDF